MAYLANMRVVKIAEAKDQLSRHLRYVKAGGHVRILDRDEPIADLVPIRAEAAAPGGWSEEDLAALEREGVIRRPKKGGPWPKALLAGGARDPEGRVLAGLLDERRRGR